VVAQTFALSVSDAYLIDSQQNVPVFPDHQQHATILSHTFTH